jgi:hypothetical protein
MIQELLEAIKKNDPIAVMRYFLAHNVDIVEPITLDRIGRTSVLCEATRYGSAAILMLLYNKMSATDRQSYSLTMIIEMVLAREKETDAAYAERQQVAMQLSIHLQQGELEKKCLGDRNLLYISAESGAAELCDYLLIKGLDLDPTLLQFMLKKAQSKEVKNLVRIQQVIIAPPAADCGCTPRLPSRNKSSADRRKCVIS